MWSQSIEVLNPYEALQASPKEAKPVRKTSWIQKLRYLLIGYIE